MRCYADDAAYYASQEGEEGELKLAEEAFIPSGLFTLEGESIESMDPPRPLAILSGHVRLAEQHVNPVTGQPFHYLSVQTLGGVVVDVVADPTVVEGEPVVGGVVAGSFWLSGRVLAAAGGRATRWDRIKRHVRGVWHPWGNHADAD